MKKILICFVFLSLELNFAALSCADILYLKNGREIEGEIIEETKDTIRISVSGGTVTFKRKAVEKTEKTPMAVTDDSAFDDKTTPRDKTTEKHIEPSEQEIIKKMARQDFYRAMSGVKISHISYAKTAAKNYAKCYKVLISYESRYASKERLKSIQLLYKYDSRNSRWIRPRKSDILQTTESRKRDYIKKTQSNSSPSHKGRKWKKEYKRSSVRRYRRLIGADQKRDEEWDD